MVTGGPVDVVTGDYLAEVTMLILARSRMRNPGGGYATSFLRQLEPVAGEIADRGIRVVVNAGGLNPAALVSATEELLSKLGVTLSVASVEGDDLLERIPSLLESHDLAHLDTGAPFSTWERDPLTANAYLGGFGIAAALGAGADIVITGRVADASLASGAAAWWWSWSPSDFDALAGAVVAGHVIECGAQATGGNFSGWLEVADLTRPGFPLAEISRDGSSVITKHPGTGGAVTVDTVTAQLLYEVGQPAYLNPDVVAHLDTVELDGDGADRVRISGVRGSPPPETTKVAITSLGGWRNSSTVVLTGLDVDEKAATIERSVRAELDGRAGISELRFVRIGQAAVDPPDQMAGSCLLEISVDGDEAACGRPFSALLVELALANYPGIYYTSVPGSGSVYGAYWPTLVPQEIIEQVVVHADGRREVVEWAGTGPPGTTGASVDPGTAMDSAPGPGVAGPSVDGPLGWLVHARSGDKGGNANVGLWVSDPAAWPWLASTLTTDRLRALLPEVASLPIDRYELPNLRAVNFVIGGLLDGGATEARRYDKQAKALGEWVRARYAPLPVDLVARAGRAGGLHRS